MGFIIKSILVLAVIAVAIWGYTTFSSQTLPPEPAPTAQVAPPIQPPVAEKPKPITPVFSAEESNDTSLSADLKSLDIQMDSMQKDSAAASSFSDTQVTQTE